MKRLPILLVSLLLVCTAHAADSSSVLVQTAPVTRQPLADRVTAFGVVRPDPEAQTTMDAGYAAFVQRVYVTLGQSVHKGDPLLQLRTAPAARAAYLSARAELRYARLELARKRKMLHEQLATHADVDAALKTLETARAAFTAQQELGTDQVVRTVDAPFTGIVSQLPVKPGNQVQVGSTLFQLARRDRLAVALGVEPEDIRRIHAGQSVTLTSVFGNGSSVTTRVTQVNAVVDPQTRLVDVIVRLRDAEALSFLPGMRVKGSIRLATHEALTVPRSAVLYGNPGAYLFVVRHGVAHRVDVVSGLERGGRIGVSGKLKAGDTVVVSGNYELTDGMSVRTAR